MKLIFLFALAVLPGAAQFRSVSVWFSGTGCASCTESLPARIRRLRGVESAAVNAEKGILEVRLAERNRVRLEQIRDFIEQDGTKTTRSVVRVAGELSKRNDRWMLQPEGVSSAYEIAGPDLSAGRCTITGEVRDLHPDSGAIRIDVSQLELRRSREMTRYVVHNITGHFSRVPKSLGSPRSLRQLFAKPLVA